MNEQQLLPEREVFTVKRCEDLALVSIEYTMKHANKVRDDYEQAYDEPCYIAPTYVLGHQTVDQRNANREI